MTLSKEGPDCASEPSSDVSVAMASPEPAAAARAAMASLGEAAAGTAATATGEPEAEEEGDPAPPCLAAPLLPPPPEAARDEKLVNPPGSLLRASKKGDAEDTGISPLEEMTIEGVEAARRETCESNSRSAEVRVPRGDKREPAGFRCEDMVALVGP